MISHDCIVLFAIFVALNCLDVASTAYIIHNGFGKEANPLMAFFIKHLELPLGLIFPKTIMCFAVWFWVAPSLILLAIVCMIYCAVAANNLWVIVKWKRSHP